MEDTEVGQICDALWRQARDVVLFVHVSKAKLGANRWADVEPLTECAWEAMQPDGEGHRAWWTIRDFVREIWEDD